MYYSQNFLDINNIYCSNMMVFWSLTSSGANVCSDHLQGLSASIFSVTHFCSSGHCIDPRHSLHLFHVTDMLLSPNNISVQLSQVLSLVLPKHRNKLIVLRGVRTQEDVI